MDVLLCCDKDALDNGQVRGQHKITNIKVLHACDMVVAGSI